MSEGRLAHRVIFVTGATTGIGRVCALSFAREGALVAVSGRNPALGEAVAAEIRDAGGDALFVKLDVSRESDWASAIAATEERFGRIDGILSNAGEVLHAPLEQLTIDQFQLVVQVNIEGTFLALKHGLAALGRSRGGALVAIASTAGLRPKFGGSAYNSSKAAVLDLVRAAASEGGRSTPRIQVNAICPGMIWSGEDADKLSAPRLREIQGIIDRTPLGRSGLPEEVAAMAILLLAGKAPSLSGNPLLLDGGLMLS